MGPLDMSGYGFYVWGSFGATTLVIAFEMVSLHLRQRRARAQAQAATFHSIQVSAAKAPQ